MKRPWQDYMMSAAGIIATASLIPSMMDPATTIPLLSSIPIAVSIAMIMAAQFSLKLKIAGWINFLTMLIWFFLAIFRHG